MINVKDLLFKKNKFKWFLLKKKIKFKIVDFDKLKIEHEFFTKKYTFNDEYIYLRHYTSLNAAKSIIHYKSIFGANYDELQMQYNPQIARSEAHFMLSDKGDVNIPKLGNEALLLLKWTGNQHEGRDDNILENTLHHDYFASFLGEAYSGKYWESRLYPNINKGLDLLGIVDSNNKSVVLLSNPINIHVVNHPYLT